MTAASVHSSQPPDSTAADGRPQEPSMEDILASIRRIIADDQSQLGKSGQSSAGRRAQANVTASPAPEHDASGDRPRTPYDDVLDLARLVPSVEAAPSDLPAVPAEAEPHEPAAHGSAEPHEETTLAALEQDSVVHYEASYEVVDDAVGSASETSDEAVSLSDPDEQTRHDEVALMHPDDEREALLAAPMEASVQSAFETLAATVVLDNEAMLERVMRDLLRPMLKGWLDDNLPALVERLVRTEIERVARGGRH